MGTPGDPATVALVAGCFLAAVCSAAFSAGGALIVLAVTTTVLPVNAIVPIHSTLLVGSTASRLLLFRREVRWRISGPFLLGSAFGVAAGATLYTGLPDSLLAVSIALLMLVSVWMPKMPWRPKIPQPWLVLGMLHALLSTLFAYGALLQSAILHTSLGKREIVGTMAGCLFGLSIFKIAGYVAVGFDYAPYLPVIGAGLIVSFAGTWVGRRIVDRISEAFFRTAYRVLVTISAVRLVYLNLAH